VVGAVCWVIADVIGGLPGVLVVFALLLVAAGALYLRSRRNPIDRSNVNEKWDGGLTPPSEKVHNPNSAQV
jgi:PiT family inorganic phosphate transporter